MYCLFHLVWRQRGVNTYAVELPLFAMNTVISTLILGSIVCIHLYKPFWIMIIDLDLPENLNLVFFCCHFFDISDISHRLVIFVSQSETTILSYLLISDTLWFYFYFSVCVCTRSDFLLC